MIERGVVQHLENRVNRAGFRVVRAVNQALDASMHQCSRTHRARLNCSKQGAVPQAVVTKRRSRLAQCDNLGMSSWIGVRDVAIPSTPDNVAVAKHNRADRDLAGFQGTLRSAQGLFHPNFVRTLHAHGLPYCRASVRRAIAKPPKSGQRQFIIFAAPCLVVS